VQITGPKQRYRPEAPGSQLASASIPPSAIPVPLGRQDLGGNSNISSKHLEACVHEGVWHIRDAGSSNGTMLGQVMVSKGKGVTGDWQQIRGGEILGLGGVFFHAVIGIDGKLQLNEMPPQVVPSSPVAAEPIYPPASPVPPGTANPYRPPVVSGPNLNMGWIRNLRFIESNGELGLQPENPASPENGKYVWVIRNPTGFMNKAKGILGGETDLVRVEYLTEGRYRIHNLGLKSGVHISNPNGKNIKIAVTGSDYANLGDSVTIEGQPLVLRP